MPCDVCIKPYQHQTVSATNLWRSQPCLMSSRGSTRADADFSNSRHTHASYHSQFIVLAASIGRSFLVCCHDLPLQQRISFTAVKAVSQESRGVPREKSLVTPEGASPKARPAMEVGVEWGCRLPTTSHRIWPPLQGRLATKPTLPLSNPTASWRPLDENSMWLIACSTPTVSTS